MPRMKILNAVEQEAFESPPVFNSVQRKQHFDFPGLTPPRRESAYTHPSAMLLLSSAYFKATKRFFALKISSARYRVCRSAAELLGEQL